MLANLEGMTGSEDRQTTERQVWYQVSSPGLESEDQVTYLSVTAFSSMDWHDISNSYS